MGKRLFAVVICLVMCLIVPVGYASGVETVSTPVWQVGDEWNYTSSNMTAKMIVTGTETVSVGGVNYDCYVVASTIVSSTYGSSNSTGYFQRSTLTNVKTVAISTYGTSTITYDPPMDVFGFPLYVGKNWSVTTTETTQSNGYSNSDVKTYTFTCLAKETITVPAGTFEAYKIRQQESGSLDYTINYYAPEVGCIAKWEQSSGDTMVLSSYKFTTAALDTTPPAAPTGLTATPGNGVVDLSWNANTESDFTGYNIYRSETSGTGYVKINTVLVNGTSYHDTGLTNGVTYYYVVTAEDNATIPNESPYLTEVSAKPEKPAEGGGKQRLIPSASIAGTGLALLAAALIIYKKRPST